MRHMLAVLFIPNGLAIFGISTPIVILGAVILIAVVALIISLVVLRNGSKSKQPAGSGAPMPDWQRQGQTADNAWRQPLQQQQPGGWGAQGVPQQQQSPPAWGSPSAASASSQPAPTPYGGGQSWGQTAQPADPWATPSPQQPQPAQQGGWPQSFQQQSSSPIPAGSSSAAHPWQQQGAPLGGGFGQVGAAQEPTALYGSGEADRTMLRTTGPQGRLGIVRVEEGKDPGRVYEVRKDSLSVGRSRESDIFLEDLAVSRLHASIMNLGNGNYGLKDEGSANGTKINGQLVPKNQMYPLQEGDKIQLGQTVLVFGSGEVYKTVLRNAQDRLDTDTKVSGPIRDTSSQDVTKALSLFAIARTTLEEDNRAFVHKVYSVQAGISQSKPEKFEGEPFDLSVSDIREPLPFDILLHASENIELLTEWQKHLRYNSRDPEPQLVAFKFRVVAPGSCSLAIDFYYERRWLRTIHFKFDAVEQSQLTAISSEG